MRFHNGVLRVEQDATLKLRRYALKRKLKWVEYLPFVVLGLLMACLLISGIFYY
jgi:hypothetical protein